MLSRVLFAIAGVGLVASTVFLGLVIAGAVRWHRRGIRGQKSEVENRNWPGVTLLKPVHGMEPRLRENLESFFRQDYPQYEIIFGARDENDAAIRLAREIAAEHPTIPVKLVFSGIPQFPNAKVFSLSRMVEHARFEHLISESMRSRPITSAMSSRRCSTKQLAASLAFTAGFPLEESGRGSKRLECRPKCPPACLLPTCSKA